MTKPRISEAHPYRWIEGLTPIGSPLVMGRFHRGFLTHRGFLNEAKIQVKSLTISRIEGPKFLILCRARSGSTLLCDLLDKTPEIHCQKEMLNKKVLWPRAYLNALAAKRRAHVYGCKLLSYQIIQVQRFRDPRGFFRRLRDDGFRFIHLRRDTFAQSLSLSKAQLSHLYHKRADDSVAPPTRQRLDPEQFVRQIRWNLGLLRMEDDLMSEFDVIQVDYNTDLIDAGRQQATVDRICAAFGVRSAAVSTTLSKLAEKPFSQSVDNAAEIATALKHAGLWDVMPEDVQRLAVSAA